MRTCIACSMPMNNKEDFGCHDVNYETCVYCTNKDGTVKSCDEIFNGGVSFFMSALGGDKSLAERLVRKNMLNLQYWNDKKTACLNGDIATDEEFIQALSKLSH